MALGILSNSVNVPIRAAQDFIELVENFILFVINIYYNS